MHDTRVFGQTNLFKRAKSGEILHVPVKKIRNVEVRSLILGDGGYPPRIGWLNHLILLQPYQEKKSHIIEYCLPLESLLRELSVCWKQGGGAY